MADAPKLIYSDQPGPIPADYRFPPGLDARLSSVSAVFDGTGAGGDFLACLSIYSQDGKLIGRFFPGGKVAAGDVAEVTFAPFLRDDSGVVPVGSAALFRKSAFITVPSDAFTDITFVSSFNTIGAILSPDGKTITTPSIGAHPLFGLALTVKLDDPATPPTVPFTIGLYGGGQPHSTHTAIDAVVNQGYEYGNSGYESDAGVVLSAQVLQDSGVDLVISRADYWIVYLGQAE